MGKFIMNESTNETLQRYLSTDLHALARMIHLNEQKTLIEKQKSGRFTLSAKYIKNMRLGTIDVEEVLRARRFVQWQWKQRTGCRNCVFKQTQVIEDAFHASEAFAT